MDCTHRNKAYAMFQYMTNPPQHPWICKDCGHKGVETKGSTSYYDEYEETLKRFKDKLEVPRG